MFSIQLIPMAVTNPLWCLRSIILVVKWFSFFTCWPRGVSNWAWTEVSLPYNSYGRWPCCIGAIFLHWALEPLNACEWSSQEKGKKNLSRLLGTTARTASPASFSWPLNHVSSTWGGGDICLRHISHTEIQCVLLALNLIIAEPSVGYTH